jgi:hypothetical protein
LITVFFGLISLIITVSLPMHFIVITSSTDPVNGPGLGMSNKRALIRGIRIRHLHDGLGHAVGLLLVRIGRLTEGQFRSHQLRCGTREALPTARTAFA